MTASPRFAKGPNALAVSTLGNLNHDARFLDSLPELYVYPINFRHSRRIYLPFF